MMPYDCVMAGPQYEPLAFVIALVILIFIFIGIGLYGYYSQRREEDAKG